jgi:hypothetical protein
MLDRVGVKSSVFYNGLNASEDRSYLIERGSAFDREISSTCGTSALSTRIDASIIQQPWMTFGEWKSFYCRELMTGSSSTMERVLDGRSFWPQSFHSNA